MKKALNNKKTKNPFKLVPWYGWVAGVIFLIAFLGFYEVVLIIIKRYANTYPLSYCPKIDVLDNAIPFAPHFFAQLYYVSYLVIIIVPIIVSTSGKRNFINFMLYSLISCLIGLALFLAFPSWQDRSSTGENLFNKVEQIKDPFTKWMMEIIIKNDGGNKAWNMAPSFHSLSSFVCMLGVMRKKDIHVAARITDYVICILIMIGTLFIKQHYIFDMISAVALGGLIYIIMTVCDLAQKILKKHPNFLKIKNKTKKI